MGVKPDKRRDDEMGAWGVGAFDNDDALDWLDEELSGAGASAVSGALTTVNETPISNYMELPEGAYGHAAAEAVAIAFGYPAENTDDTVRGHVNEHAEEIIAMGGVKIAASLALDRITSDNSELYELWTENDETGAQWSAAIADLQARLRK